MAVQVDAVTFISKVLWVIWRRFCRCPSAAGIANGGDDFCSVDRERDVVFSAADRKEYKPFGT